MLIQEAGTYEGVIADHCITKSSKGSARIEMVISSDGDTITHYGYLTDKAMEGTFKHLRELGWTGEKISDLDKPMEEVDQNDRSVSLRGTPVIFKVEMETYDNKQYSKVKSVWAKDRPKKEKVKAEADELKKLDAISKKLAKTIKAEAAPKAETTTTTDDGEEEIPF